MSTIYVTATGDALFVDKLPEEYETAGREVRDFIRSCDVRITNLETNLSDFDLSPNQYSGGTWLNTRKKYLKYLTDIGFNYFGTANNHCMDYGKEGLLSTIDTLDAAGVKHSGTGRTLQEAEKAATLEVKRKKVAIFAVDASANPASRAAVPSKFLKGRAGVNGLAYTNSYTVSEEDLNRLKEIARKTGINFAHNNSVQTGYALPDPDGVLFFGGLSFTSKKGVPSSACNKKDKERLLHNITAAKKENDYVFLLVHCHENDRTSHSNPPEFLKDFCKAAIDAGVSAVFGGGCHALRGLEIYHNCPIFYSLGDFFYQGMMVEYLPADFMQKYNLDVDTTAKDALWARSRGGKVGLHLMRENFLSVLPKLAFENGKLVSLSMLPVFLNFDKQGEMNGLPVHDAATDGEIFEKFAQLSSAFGTKLKLENGLIHCEL